MGIASVSLYFVPHLSSGTGPKVRFDPTPSPQVPVTGVGPPGLGWTSRVSTVVCCTRDEGVGWDGKGRQG